MVRNEDSEPKRVLPIDPDMYQPELLLKNGSIVPAYSLRLACRAAIPEEEMPLIWPNNALRASYQIAPPAGYSLNDVIKCRIPGLGEEPVHSRWFPVARPPGD